jgi:hypothetical protein
MSFSFVSFFPSTLFSFFAASFFQVLHLFGLKIPVLDPEPDSAKSPVPDSDATSSVLQYFII